MQHLTIIETLYLIEDGTYVGMSNTNDTVLIGKAGWEDARYLDGTMKNLKFYNYEKLT